MTVGFLTETIGTAGNNSFSGVDRTVLYGLAGNDTFSSTPSVNSQLTSLFVGGSGGDSYTINNGSSAVILDSAVSGTAGDSVIARGIGINRDTSFLVEVEGRHLYVGDTLSDQYVFLLDWKQSQNQIESFTIEEGTFSFFEISSAIEVLRNDPSSNFIGNLTWAQLQSLGEIDSLPLGLTPESINRAIDLVGARSTSLELQPAIAGTDVFARDGLTGSILSFDLSTPVGAANPQLGLNRPIGRTIPDSTWEFEAAGDFNGDGANDLLLRHYGGSGQHIVWYMNNDGTQILSEGLIGRPVVDPNWSIVGSDDLDSDGNTDILLRNAGADQTVVWYMNSNGTIKSESIVGRGFGDNNWNVVGTADFNGDGKNDILLRNRVSTQIVVWQMNGATIEQEYLLGRVIGDPAWEIEGVMDASWDQNLSRGSTPSILLRNAVSNQALVWQMEGSQITAELPLTQPGGASSFGTNSQLLAV